MLQTVKLQVIQLVRLIRDGIVIFEGEIDTLKTI